MKKILIVDGYNVIRRNRVLNAAAGRSLQCAREQLAVLAASYKSPKAVFDQIMLVFDGKGERTSVKKYFVSKDLMLIYSSYRRSADETIRALIQSLIREYRISVVSDDNYVANIARAFKADIIETEDFVKKLRSRQSHTGIPKKIDRCDEKGISLRAKKEINDELKRFWNIK